VLFFRLQGEGAREILGSRARRSTRACAVIVYREVDVDHTSPPSSPGLRPADALAILRTGYCLVVPVDAEVRHVEAFVCFGLPGVVLEGRADEVDLASVAKNEVTSADLGRVRQLLCGQQPTRGEPVLNGRELFYVGGGRSSGVDVCDQMR
jgi:hypothetical protein